jgi:glycerophosphoryl diester phosphodiesterase
MTPSPADRSSLLHRALAVVLTLVVALGLAVVTTTPAEARGLNLHRGSHGPKVRLLETRLHRLHLLPASAVDGRYRQATVKAVKRFQRSRHLRVTGRVNARVWRRVARAARAVATPVATAPAPTGPPPVIVGHRGAVSATTPENTLAAMKRAAPWAGVVEFDLRLTADHKLVLMHDVTLDRTTNCTGAVITWTLAALRAQCKVGTLPIPTFDEVAAYVASTSMRIAPEIKNADISDADLSSLLGTIDAHGLAGRTVVQSFTASVLQRVHAVRPDLRLMLVSTQPMTLATARDADADTVAIRLEHLSAAQVASYHQGGLKVWTFTAIDTPTLDQAHRLHVDAVLTDVPELAHQHYSG